MANAAAPVLLACTGPVLAPLRPEPGRLGGSCLNHPVRLINSGVNPSNADCLDRAKSRLQRKPPDSISRTCLTCSGCIPVILDRLVLNAPAASLRSA